MNGFIGGFLIQAIGSFIKWCFYTTYTVVLKKEPITFQDYRKRNKKLDDYEAIMLRGSDFFVGLLFCVVVLILIYHFY